MRSVGILTIFLGLAGPAAAQHGGAAESPEWFLPSEKEITLALSAAPEAAGGEATVYVLGENGYVVAREGGNDFSCMVRRLGHWKDVLPICFDAEASEAIMPVYQDMVLLLMEGKTRNEISELVAERYESGMYHAPKRTSVAYMLSRKQQFYNTNTQSATRYFPHVMIYSPYIKNIEIGASREQINGVPVPFVAFEDGPGSYIVVPVGPRGTGKAPDNGGSFR